MSQGSGRQGFLERSRNRRRRRTTAWHLGIVLAVCAVVLSTTPIGHDTPTVDTPVAPAAYTPSLPIDLPSSFTSPKKVFAHYFPPYPWSIDNAAWQSDYYATQYLTPTGEGGKHSAYGGFLRDRPFPRDPRTGTDWKFQDLRQEVAIAQARGLDGFTVDILTKSTSTNPVASVPAQLMLAATSVNPNFKIMLMPDMNGELGAMSVADLAAEMNKYASSPAVYKLADGRLVVSPFLAEKHPATWWAQFISVMKTTYKITVAFVPTFLDAGANMASFASVSYGMSNWGNRNPAGNPVTNTGTNSPVDLATKAHALGKIWMQPVSFQDSRPNQQIYDEAQNTTNLRNSWQIAINTNSEWVQMTTWNDYSEGATFAPSFRHILAPLDVSSYYLTKFKTGADPAILRDTIYLSHRTQLAGTAPSYRETALMKLRAGSSPTRDTVEVLTFMTAPAQVYVQDGTAFYGCNVPAGVSSCTFPLTVGKIGSVAQRNGQTVTQLASPYEVVANPYVQTLDYTMSGSR